MSHGLKIIPISAMLNYVEWDTFAYMMLKSEPHEIRAVPGTVQVADNIEEGVFVKKITFNVGKVTPELSQLLDIYRKEKVAALYVDDNGNLRVCGSPSYPLSFSYEISGGVYKCTLEGKGTAINPFYRKH